MQLDFSEEQRALQADVRRFFERACPISTVRKVIDSGDSHDPVLWKQVSEQGFLAAAIPEAFGGAGAGYLELCLVAEEVGRALAPLPAVSSLYQAAELILMTGSDAQKRTWLPRIASGDVIATVAVAEAAGNVAADLISAQVSGGKLTGRKWPVSDGLVADLAIVAARCDQGISLYLVDLASAGVSRRAVKSIDPSRPQAEILFDGVAVELLGAAGEGLGLIDAVRDRAAILVAFEQIGGAQAALDMARDYALGRYAFGRPIGGFQAIKHMLADMYVSLELARSNSYYGAWALATNAPQLPLAAATARVSAIEAYKLCSSNNIQTHGGMGFTWEFDCHLHYRRARYLASVLGTSPLWERKLVAAYRSAA
ncbi:acyl-CoA dehydrogenase family protein [Sphingobium sp. HBC34]|uniref:Acyl-CoA dehydrogenase family protein n=1 Tax=Sphingobium cyanobacteriorum TaxID=3063954 RepID=A0ABT8ZPG4_9SPHN|nr:acyl-CoA dehydrogenase family protein [Sphingobium sp. HBC34]MDO7836417.1 acyl-CoA dehydrogenase family protein [Sphingobium sp. HBC34]